MWSNEEIQDIRFGDKRLNARLVKIMEAFTENPMASIPEACSSAAATKATYRFLSNKRVNTKKIINGSIQSAVKKIEQEKEVIFAVDTTDIDYSQHQKVSGLGHLNMAASRGILLHSTMAISTVGCPFGIIDHKQWTRDVATFGKSNHKKRFSFEEKESYRWAESLRQIEKVVPPHIHAIMVADREADIYDLFAMDRAKNVDLVIRSAHNRNLTESHQKLFTFLEKQPAAGTFEIVVPRSGTRKERVATLEVRFSPITLPLPGRDKHEIRKEIPLTAIEVKEISTTDNPILWRLLTTMSDVNSLEGAIKCARFYSMRWLIERYHFTLKSGCQIEELQLETGEGLMRALALYSIVACRILYITYAARTKPNAPCTEFISNEHWEALYRFQNKVKKIPKNLHHKRSRFSNSKTWRIFGAKI